MSLYGMMRTSVSGMASQAERLATVADNIANTSTVGYKRTTIEFNTHVLDSDSGVYNSGSVNTTQRAEIGRQGALKSTSSPTDLAINGSGFFIVQNGSEEFFLTRAGSFLVDSAGNLVNSAGNYLMGYDLGASGNAPVANGFGGLSPINVGLQDLIAVGTTEAELLANLPANADIVAAGSLPSDNVATAEYSGKTSLLMYDTLGNEKTVDVYYAKTADNIWEATIYDNAVSTSNAFPYASGPLAQATIEFDPLTGKVLGGGGTAVNFTLPGGNAVSLDMTGISQLGSAYTVVAAQSNGSSPSSVSRVEIAGDGMVYGIFNNGFTVPVFQLALGKVTSPDNLRATPGNNYSVTIDSGDVLVGTAESGGIGNITSGALEESNVDMASELTIMIESQRSYTANSKVFQTGSELMDVLINLKR